MRHHTDNEDKISCTKDWLMTGRKTIGGYWHFIRIVLHLDSCIALYKTVADVHFGYYEFTCAENVEDYRGYLAQLCKLHQCFLLDKLKPKQLFSAFYCVLKITSAESYPLLCHSRRLKSLPLPAHQQPFTTLHRIQNTLAVQILWEQKLIKPLNGWFFPKFEK